MVELIGTCYNNHARSQLTTKVIKHVTILVDVVVFTT